MTKKYGYYEGILTQEGINAVKNGAEIELYLTINSLGDFIWRMNHDAAHGRFEMTESIKEDLEKAQYAIEFAVLNSCRFGIEIPEPKENEHVQRTESYNKWFRWWNNYFQYKLSDEEYREFENILTSSGDINKYRPEGDWRE